MYINCLKLNLTYLRTPFLTDVFFRMFRLVFYQGCNLYTVCDFVSFFYLSVRFAYMICFGIMCAIVTLSLKATYLCTYLRHGRDSTWVPYYHKVDIQSCLHHSITSVTILFVWTGSEANKIIATMS